MDSLYVITSISDLNNGGFAAENSWYSDDYINFSLLIFTIGFLFKVSAAPFHFWSPDQGPGKSFIFGYKLSNSGEALELLVPSFSRKDISGWSNHSCKVISQKTSEKNVGNLGSKSVLLNNIAVKEQRVYGSWYGFPYLRSTLTGFKRNYQVKNLSNLIIQKQFYSQTCKRYQDNNLTVDNKHTLLSEGYAQAINEPWFITGFADAEGCFLVIVRKALKNKLGWQLEPSFIINLHKRDVELLKLIQIYFGGIGRIGKERNGCCDFTVSSLDQILDKIILHFDKYPLKTQKLADYLLFREVVMMMKDKEHLTAEGLQEIINIRATLNKGLTPALKEAFPNSVAVLRPQLSHLHTLVIHPQWIAGFTSGDGSFKVNIRVSKGYKVGARVNIIFVLTQHVREESLLKSLVNFFGCGQAYSYANHTEYISQSFKDNYEKILPFFRKYPVIGVKLQDFEDWGKVAELIKMKVHLTNEGFYHIRQISKSMNKGRYVE